MIARKRSLSQGPRVGGFIKERAGNHFPIHFRWKLGASIPTDAVNIFE
jgi:hypothetical protein